MNIVITWAFPNFYWSNEISSINSISSSYIITIVKRVCYWCFVSNIAGMVSTCNKLITKDL